jgi:Anti-sigma-K factor rskA, C-terminal/Putative zinc-finger
MAAPLSCNQYEELLVDYLLHPRETEAVSAVTEHLSTCDRCRTQGTAYEAVLDQLAQAVPQQEPPTELGARVLTAAVEGTMLTASVPPPLAQDRAYQPWLGWGDRPRENGGDEQGFGMISVTAQRPFTAYQRVGITEEPAGGSPGPTSPRVIGATLQGF